MPKLNERIKMIKEYRIIKQIDNSLKLWSQVCIDHKENFYIGISKHSVEFDDIDEMTERFKGLLTRKRKELK
jgi:hypothetical protein